MYHSERTLAANPTRYEYPDCAECRELKDSMVHAFTSYTSYRPPFDVATSKSRWPKAWRDESYKLEMASNLARAKYEVHLGTVHKDENHRSDSARNMSIIIREGRLKP
jgi:hypothetical protein